MKVGNINIKKNFLCFVFCLFFPASVLVAADRVTSCVPICKGYELSHAVAHIDIHHLINKKKKDTMFDATSPALPIQDEFDVHQES